MPWVGAGSRAVVTSRKVTRSIPSRKCRDVRRRARLFIAVLLSETGGDRLNGGLPRKVRESCEMRQGRDGLEYREEPAMTRPRIEPFTLSVPQGLLDDLAARLRATRWPRGVVESGGLPMREMRPLVEHWLHGFDWRQQEKRLNRWEHFQTTIAGARMHFI